MKSFMALYTIPCIVLCRCQRLNMTRFSTTLPIPVTFGILVQRRKHDGEDNFHIVADEIAEVLIVPEVKSPLGHLYSSSQWSSREVIWVIHLEMRAGNGLR